MFVFVAITDGQKLHNTCQEGLTMRSKTIGGPVSKSTPSNSNVTSTASSSRTPWGISGCLGWSKEFKPPQPPPPLPLIPPSPPPPPQGPPLTTSTTTTPPPPSNLLQDKCCCNQVTTLGHRHIHMSHQVTPRTTLVRRPHQTLSGLKCPRFPTWRIITLLLLLLPLSRLTITLPRIIIWSKQITKLVAMTSVSIQGWDRNISKAWSNQTIISGAWTVGTYRTICGMSKTCGSYKSSSATFDDRTCRVNYKRGWKWYTFILEIKTNKGSKEILFWELETKPMVKIRINIIF